MAPFSPSPRRRLRRTEETSAGGLVLDDHSEMANAALIARRDRNGDLLWSLPKGHVEAGETAEQTAVREVAEETGVTGRVLGRLGMIDFWFVTGRTRVHKTVHHYLLLRTTGELSDVDVEVTEVAWVPLVDVPQLLAYDDERSLLHRVPAILTDSM
ncbi:NUDIX hydrolase [Candidatus Protofrankia californiensis]|uniref:NUDIX hydrolase n=1 Tax=Candidatus Protofrankia californiensis TaxID=1839754 RepID=UPI001041A68E|nr:NUDIX hydrolase [Candidatus Protofrankia californiensis]